MAVRRFLEQSSDPLDDDVEQLSRTEGRSVLRLLRIRRDVISHASKEIERFLPDLAWCNKHFKSIPDFRRQANQLHIPTEEALRAFSLCCASCASCFRSSMGQSLRKELRSYIEEMLQGAVRQEGSEHSSSLKIRFPAVPTGLLKAESKRSMVFSFPTDWMRNLTVTSNFTKFYYQIIQNGGE